MSSRLDVRHRVGGGGNEHVISCFHARSWWVAVDRVYGHVGRRGNGGGHFRVWVLGVTHPCGWGYVQPRVASADSWLETRRRGSGCQRVG